MGPQMREGGSQQTRRSFFTLLIAVHSRRTWCHKMMLLIKFSNCSRESEQMKQIAIQTNEAKSIFGKRCPWATNCCGPAKYSGELLLHPQLVSNLLGHLLLLEVGYWARGACGLTWHGSCVFMDESCKLLLAIRTESRSPLLPYECLSC